MKFVIATHYEKFRVKLYHTNFSLKMKSKPCKNQNGKNNDHGKEYKQVIIFDIFR